MTSYTEEGHAAAPLVPVKRENLMVGLLELEWRSTDLIIWIADSAENHSRAVNMEGKSKAISDDSDSERFILTDSISPVKIRGEN